MRQSERKVYCFVVCFPACERPESDRQWDASCTVAPISPGGYSAEGVGVKEGMVQSRAGERLLRDLPSLPWCTLGIVAVLAAWHFLAAYLSRYDDQAMIFWLLVVGAKVNVLFLEGEWWRLLASGLLHGTFPHLLVNCVGLLLVGWYVERSLGKRTLIVTFMLATIAGALLSVWLTDAPSVGASGGMFGLLGAAVADGLRRWKQLPAVVRWYVIGLPAVLGVTSILYGLLAGNVDNHAHLGGLVLGVISGLALPLLDGKKTGMGGWANRLVTVGTVMTLVFVTGAMVRHQALAFDLPTTRVSLKTGGTGYRHFYPENWSPGAFQEGRCQLGSIPGDGGIQCYVDPYYSVFLVARDERLIQSPVGTEVFRRAHLEDTESVVQGFVDDRIFWHRDMERRLAFALMAFEPISHKYAPLFAVLTVDPEDNDRRPVPGIR